MKTSTPAQFRHFLQEELLRRCRANPAYSLRAFGRSLDMEPSALSKILAGKRRLTRQTFERLAERLNLTPAQMNQYMPSEKLRRKNSGTPTPAYSDLDIDLFATIADWYHFAILELTTIRSFRPDPAWIAKVLKISVTQVNLAVTRLKTLGLLEITAEGKWLDKSSTLSAYRVNFTNRAARQLQRQVLEMSIRALEEVPVEQRDHSSMTMAIDAAKLPEAKARIKKFRRELCEFLGDSSGGNAVYQLAVSLYPLTSIQGDTP